MPVSSARRRFVCKTAVSAGYCGGIAALLVLFGANSLQNAVANGDTRTITLHHIHLKEDTTVTFKVNGRYVPEALKKINYALRDWRTNQPTEMDPHLIDALWEVYREVGASEPIHVIGGYRSPATNAMLRRRSSGVAKHSLHMQGKAVDFFIPDVSLEAIREAGLRLKRGGVGFYPTSGAPFVHMDVGSVRHWPRIPEAQLARIMSKGPLTQVAKNATPKGKQQPVQVASATQDNAENVVTASTARSRTAAPAKQEPVRTAAAAIVPLPRSKPASAPAAVATAEETPSSGFSLASAETRAAPARPARAASLVANADASANDIINERGYWQGLVEPNTEAVHVSAAQRAHAPRPPADIPNAEAEETGSVAQAGLWSAPNRQANATALAYASPTAEPAVERAPPMGSTATRNTPARETTVAVKRGKGAPEPKAQPQALAAAPAKTLARLNDPWMRAMILSPNAQDFMSTSLMGANDFRNLASYMHKPAVSVMMTFSEDPYLGMSADHFQGNAVVFVSTVTFGRQTAALR